MARFILVCAFIFTALATTGEDVFAKDTETALSAVEAIAESRKLIDQDQHAEAAKTLKSLGSNMTAEAQYLLGTIIADHGLPGDELRDAVELYLASLEDGYPGAFYRMIIVSAWYNETHRTQDVIDHIIPQAKELPKDEFTELVVQISALKIFTTAALLLSADLGDTRANRDKPETLRTLTEEEVKKSNELFQKWQKRTDTNWKEFVRYFYKLSGVTGGAIPPQ